VLGTAGLARAEPRVNGRASVPIHLVGAGDIARCSPGTGSSTPADEAHASRD